MLCKKQSAIIIVNNKQTNPLLKNWLRLHSGSGPSLEKPTPAPLLFSKIVKTPAGVDSDTPAPVHLCKIDNTGWQTNYASSVLIQIGLTDWGCVILREIDSY